ncbi:MAG: Neisseria PilC protein [Steroidobacteraceae bacterium]|nr:Neisseria PilC protein [Steroidobacteraceae bacterium]
MNECRAIKRLLTLAASLAISFAGPAWADPDEAWLMHAPLPAGVRPLLVIVLDTSVAMERPILIAEPYDSRTDYAPAVDAAHRCDSQRVYWRRGPGSAPDCATMTGLSIETATAQTGMNCDSARHAIASHGYFVTARAAQWNPMGKHWGAPRKDSVDAVECRSDRGRHGHEAGPWFATDGPSGPWSGMAAAEIDWDAAPHGDPFIFYAGNFLNYLAASSRTTETTLAAAVIAMITAAIDSTDELDVALIRYSDREPDAAGGFVMLAPASAAVAAARIPALLTGLFTSAGAPLAETMTEIVAWMSGDHVRYGGDARADAAARDPQDPMRYLSPFASPCRPATIAVTTPGISSQDEEARLIAQDLPGFSELTGGCDANCAPAIAQWLAQADLRVDLPGRQFASLNWVTQSPRPTLVAESQGQAGGTVESAENPLAFANVVARSLQHSVAIAAGPQLSEAGLLLADESSSQPAVFYGLSAPRPRHRWLGNLLRYGLQAPASLLATPVVIGRDGQAALDPETGMPRQDSSSAWSDHPDGNDLLSGGAAAQLPVAALRRLYSDVTSDVLTSARNRLVPGNVTVNARLLGLGPQDQENPDNVMSWLLNQRRIGDPGQHAPSTVSDAGDGTHTVFLATHDGLLHSFDGDTGAERWAFIPRQLLPRLPELMRDEETIIRSHGIDGTLLLHRYDPDGDGQIDVSAGEHLWLIFGLGRGGSGYYALDVASPDEPGLMWSLDPTDLGGDAESWPEPVISRLTIDGAGQTSSWVVALAGGYDRAFDFPHAPANSAGASLSIFDAASGHRLWRAAGNAALLPDLRLPEMTASLASAPSILDLDGDGYADRLYLVDVGGGLWRMDLRNGAVAANLAQARLVARLGGEGQRFYSTPDIAMVRESSGLVPAISIGSGWLARPRDAGITDRIYSIRDRQSTGATLREPDLHEATDGQQAMPASAPGWFVRLDAHGPGEKVIGSSLTFDHRLHFLTYQPETAPASAVCGPPQAVRRLRTLDVRTGLPSNRLNLPGDPDERELPGSGLPSGLRFAFPGPWEGACPDCRARPFGLIGTEIFDAGFANDPVKTSWRTLPIEPDSR